MARFYIEWHGCSLNKADAEKLRHALVSAGHALVDSPDNADYCIINTCAVKSPTEEKIIERLKKLGELAIRKNLKLIAIGCLVEINPERIKKVAPQALLFGVEPEELGAYLGVKLDYSPSAPSLPYNDCISIIPVSRGCLNQCSYCCVRIVRGRLKSNNPDDIDNAFANAIKRSREIWLTATDLACYGFDIGTNICELLKRLLKNPGDYRIRLGMLNPQHVKRYFDELLQVMEDKRIYKFFHLPVQSGSDEVLKKMARGYSSADFEALVEKVRKKFPDAVIATDIIVGFPGETQADFEKTIDLLKRVKPDVVNVSRYSKRPKTNISERMIQSETVKERSRVVSKIVKEIALQRNKEFIGRELSVLLSEKGIKGGLLGRTDSYKPVVVDSNAACSFIRVKITDAKATHLVGIPVE